MLFGGATYEEQLGKENGELQHYIISKPPRSIFVRISSIKLDSFDSPYEFPTSLTPSQIMERELSLVQGAYDGL